MGLSPSRQEQGEINAFVDFAKTGDVVGIRRGMEHLNGRDENGETALHMACMFGQLEVVQEFMQQGSALEIDPVDADDTTPLMFAAHQGYFEIVLKLIRAGASVAKTDRLGWTALHHASAGGHSLCVGYLIEKGSLPFERDTAGATPLWLAADSCDAETVRLLLLYGSHPDEANFDGISPLEAARESAGESLDKTHALHAIERMLEFAIGAWNSIRTTVKLPTDAISSSSRAVLRNGQTPSEILLGDDKNEFYRSKEEMDDTEDNPNAQISYQVRVAAVALLKVNEAFVEPYGGVKKEAEVEVYV